MAAVIASPAPPTAPAGPGAVQGPLARESTSSGTSNEALVLDEKRGGVKQQKRRSFLGLGKPTTNTPAAADDTPASKSKRRSQDALVTAARRGNTSAAPGRAKTFWRAARELYKLDQAQVDAFMDSYVIYSLDWSDEDAMRRALGPDFQRRVGDCLRAYYGVLNHLCALGDVEKMYIPPLMDKALSVRENQLAYEESIAKDLGLKPGDRVLDLGCGRGRVAAHMATLVPGIRVTGLNIDPNQLAQARAFNATELGLPNDFVEHDFNELPLPFADDSMDAFYQIQALSLCRDHKSLFTELYRVLRPGARLSILDWVSLPAYDAANPEHAELMRRVKPLIGAVGTPTPASMETALREAGFEVVRSDNASVDGLQAPLIDNVDVYFRSLRKLILGLVRAKVLPPHLKTLMNRLCLDGQAFVEMDNRRLTTTSHRIIAQKPAAPAAVAPTTAAATPTAAETAEPAPTAAATATTA
ncbi:hypothetical protein MAPG_08196 [Magnaporthiopsis poae ATCC 64411]|uniref:Methyltransferase type 11 domain-containing protein n=1 Tax=Magnaporthiopsis poae (strain ATCC 64411 / 73-15) TaxID=644358 RepID=A0A0C4E6Q0_MAGP6|nr:hypothetical protein MAPG_08196 [Magnaporthiopsis poae ATCC 64411]